MTPPTSFTQDVDVMAVSDDPNALQVNPETPEAIEIPNDDGTITIEFPLPVLAKPQPKFDDNLAEYLDEFTLGRIAETTLEGIENDERDRSEWLQQRADGLDLLGYKIEKPGAANVGSSSTAVAGQATVRDGLLGDACERFRANAFAELCPSEGPCKVVNYGDETSDADQLAEDFERDINFYLTTVATEYYPDTNKMLWWTGYASGMFKKVYKCPIRNRPVSESVDGADLIVPSNATDLRNAQRVTHQINTAQGTLRRMQILGVYRDILLGAPTPQPNALQNKEADVVGMNANQTREQDQYYTIYECYTDLDIPGYEHKIKGKITGLPLPYVVTIDKDSRKILAIRRNWREPKEDDDDTALPVAKIPFVMYAYSLGLGFYGTGLLHKLGNYAMALTAGLRITLDSGMFSNFPGFLFAKPMGRQLQSEFRVPPGGGAPIDVSAVGNDIGKAVMPLPYKPVDQSWVAFQQQVRENATRIGGTAEAPTGEGVQNAPVGSVLAAIDQATRVEGGVHKMLYAAQREELGLLKELFRDDPESLWRDNKRPALGADYENRLARFKQALESCELVPASDPNVPSHLHRLAKAQAYLQAATMPTTIGEFNVRNVLQRWGRMVRIDDIEADFKPVLPPPPPQVDPAAAEALRIQDKNADTNRIRVLLDAKGKQEALQSKENIEALKMAHGHVAAMDDGAQQTQDAALKQAQIVQKGIDTAVKAHNAHEDRAAKQTDTAMDIAKHIATHPESQDEVNQELMGLAPFLSPVPTQANAPLNQPVMATGGPVVPSAPPSVEAILDEIERYITRTGQRPTLQ